MNPILNIATTAVREAAKIIMTGYDRIDSVAISKNSKGSFTSTIDTMAEQAIIDVIHKYYPDHNILSEELYPDTVLDNKADFWIIDPLDGTKNFIRGIPHFAISIAFYTSGKVEHAVVYDPYKDEMFYASKGCGAYLNKKRIRVAKTKLLSDSLIVTSLPNKKSVSPDFYFATVAELYAAKASCRNFAATSLDLCYVASARLDGFFSRHLNIWDIAAAVLIAKEAGCYAMDFSGSGRAVHYNDIICANPEIYKKLHKIIMAIA